MQQPTCSNLRIRSTADAHKIFMAVKQGLLRMVSRRLDADERLALRSGCIYAWEERGPHTETTGLGIERFTEGRRWSPSRVRDEFLFYYEKYSPPPDLNNPGGKLAEVKAPRDWDPLVKQTYSVWVETEKGRRKWHLTAYFTQATIDQLSTVENIPRLRELAIPEGMFKSTRLAKNRSRIDENKSSDVARGVNSRSYAAYPTPYQYQTKNPRGTPGVAVLMHEPYLTRQSTPVYETSHSPMPPQDGGHYHQNQTAYPNQNGSQSFPSISYHRPSITLSNSMPSYSHSNSNGMPPSARHEEANSYYPTPSPWSNENGLDYSLPPPQRLAELGVPSSPMTTPATYNQADNDSLSYTCQSPAPMHNNSTPLYSTPYSVNSGYSPLPPPPALTLPNPAERGSHLSPLSIPERSNGVQYAQDPSPISPEELPTLQNGTESYVRAAPELAPLNVIRRPFHRRALQDELTLRMLRASQANP